MLTVGSLFSGIGGFDAGFELAGSRVIWNCEIDDRCRSVLRHHWPGVPRFKDVRTVTGAGLRAAGLVPDVLAGGFPCQDLSVAGARAGLDGERSGLFFEFARIAEETQAPWIVVENVPGLLSAGCKPACPGGCVKTHGGAMGTVLGTLVDIGYSVAWSVLDAQYFGVAQRRRRVFIVGHLGDGPGAADVLLEPEGVRRDPPTRRTAGPVAAGSAPGGVASNGDVVTGQTGSIPPVAGTLGGGSGNRGWCDDLDRATFIPVVPELSREHYSTRGQRNDHNEQTFLPVAFQPTAGQDVQAGVDISPTIKVGSTCGSGYGPAVAFHLTQDPIVGDNFSPAISNGCPTGQATIGVQQGLAVRRLTPMECLRLQGFPDGWFDGLKLPDSAKYRMIGNAVAVPVVVWLARRLEEAT